MRVLVIGSGGREHALAWKLSHSQRVEEIHVAPGNGGTAAWRNVSLAPDDMQGLRGYIRTHGIDFVVPGPEAALVAGITDVCREFGVPCFGPDAYCAQLEGSKIFAKETMRAAGVPTADYAVFTDYDAAAEYVKSHGAPIVVKADGLAAGKGVVVAATEKEALDALDAMLRKKTLGDAGARVLLEDTLQGEEISLLAFCDGEKAVPLPSAQDHKRVFDHDKGPNTGGMGAYSPAPLLPFSEASRYCELTVTPILQAMKQQGHPFVGVLYAGLMFTPDGPMVLEYNTRFGDPECQPLLMRFEGDLLAVMESCVQGRLDASECLYTAESAVCVVLSAPGYPGTYEKGIPIDGIELAEALFPGKVKVFQAGTREADGRILSDGGRVLGVTALGEGLAEARERAYAAVARINMPGAHFRTDIGAKGLQRLQIRE